MRSYTKKEFHKSTIPINKSNKTSGIRPKTRSSFMHDVANSQAFPEAKPSPCADAGTHAKRGAKARSSDQSGRGCVPCAATLEKPFSETVWLSGWVGDLSSFQADPHCCRVSIPPSLSLSLFLSLSLLGLRGGQVPRAPCPPNVLRALPISLSLSLLDSFARQTQNQATRLQNRYED